MAKALESFERKAAKERQTATQGNRQSGAVKFTEPEKGRAADKVAEAVGVTRKPRSGEGRAASAPAPLFLRDSA